MYSFSNESFTCFFIGDHSDHLKEEQRLHVEFGKSQKVAVHDPDHCFTTRRNNNLTKKKRPGKKELNRACRESQPSISSIKGINSKSSCCHLYTYKAPQRDLTINTIYSAHTLVSESVSQINMPACDNKCNPTTSVKGKKERRCGGKICSKTQQLTETKQALDDLPTSDVNWPNPDDDVSQDTRSEVSNKSAKKREKGVQSLKAPTINTETQCDSMPSTNQPSSNPVNAEGPSGPSIVVNGPDGSVVTSSNTDVSRKSSGTRAKVENLGDKASTRSDVSNKPSNVTNGPEISDYSEGPSSSDVPKEFRPHATSSKSSEPNLNMPDQIYNEIEDLRPIIKLEVLQNSQRHQKLLDEISEMKKDINDIKALIANSKGRKWQFPCKKGDDL